MHLGCEGFVNYTFFVPLNKSLALIVNEIFFSDIFKQFTKHDVFISFSQIFLSRVSDISELERITE